MRPLLGSLAATAVFLGVPRVLECAACSCMGPSAQIVGPDRVDDAALNARVRFEVPYGASTSDAVLRVHEGPKVDTTSRTFVDGSLTFVELSPTKLLAPSTRYEVAVVDPSKFPSTTVLGTFKTGTTSDTVAPKLDALGTAVARGNNVAGGGDCRIQGPWIEVGPVRVSDPGRPDAKLLFAVWAGDAAGNVDTSKPPTSFVVVHEGRITIGRRSLCDLHDFPIPSTPFASLAIAAVDESGNTSAIHRARVDLRGVGAHP